jgi:hypothetical protein
LKWSKYNLGGLEGRSLKIGKRKSVRITTMDNSESNINFIQILAALQHLQQESAVLRDLVTCLQNQPPLPAPVLLALARSPQSPRSVCQKSLMEHASNFEVLLARYA